VKAAAYVRVSSREQESSGLGLAAQKDAVSAAAALREDWTLSHIAVEIASAGNMRRRPVLANLLNDLDRGRYDALIVSRLDRLARSVGDFAGMLDRADKHGWTLVCLSPNVDMSDPYGRMMAQVAATFAELERALISIRTKEALANPETQAKQRARWDRMRFSDPVTIGRMIRLHDAGESYGAIARQLNFEGIPTIRNGTWTATTVRAIIIRERGNIHV
jgi:DNA invertase Pin-like site-specific DNA recombinase